MAMVLMEQVYTPGQKASWQVPLYHRVYRVHNNRVEVHEGDIPVMMAEGFRVVKNEEPAVEPVVEAEQAPTVKKSGAKRPKG